MNDVYFACLSCRVMTDAGYRWAYWTLEHPGVVKRGEAISAGAVFAAREYWSGVEVEESAWLRGEVLPTVRTFLEAHGAHHLTYGDHEQLTGDEPKAFLEWLEIGPAASPTPRWFAEVLHLQSWAEVIAWTGEHRAPWWWNLEELKDVARVRFGELVKRRAG
jgi:hypothetical protein